ncbi:hypothetical protein JCM9279_006303 [Rhodotorula babjevae]
MSASLARRVFKPMPAQAVVHRTSCPVSRFLPAGALDSAGPSSVSARTANAVAHLAVGAALAASAFTVLTHPDSLFFDHPPRSAISWTPERHLASRELHTAAARPSRSSSPPQAPTGSPSLVSAAPPAPSIVAARSSMARPVIAASVAGADWHWELRLAGVLGRSLSGP